MTIAYATIVTGFLTFMVINRLDINGWGFNLTTSRRAPIVAAGVCIRAQRCQAP